MSQKHDRISGEHSILLQTDTRTETSDGHDVCSRKQKKTKYWVKISERTKIKKVTSKKKKTQINLKVFYLLFVLSLIFKEFVPQRLN